MNSIYIGKPPENLLTLVLSNLGLKFITSMPTLYGGALLTWRVNDNILILTWLYSRVWSYVFLCTLDFYNCKIIYRCDMFILGYT